MEHLKRDASGTWQFDPYFAYLATIRDRLPAQVYAFASTWDHYALDNPRSLHDSWLEQIEVREAASGTRSEQRRTEMTLRLLGPMHDRIQVLRYRGVTDYRVQGTSVARGHGDLLVHELRLSRADRLVHELLFANGAEIVVECGHLDYDEQAKPASHPGAA